MINYIILLMLSFSLGYNPVFADTPPPKITIGPLDGQAPNADGLTVIGAKLYQQSADDTFPGLVNNTAQSFSGVKTFLDGLFGNLTGNASTSSAFDHVPSPCAVNNYAISIAANGDLGCTSAVYRLVGGIGFVPHTITGSGTFDIDVGTTANKIVQLTSGAQLPAVDGNLLTNLNAAAKDLSNLLPTNINADFTFNTGADVTIKTKNDSAATQSIRVQSGGSSAGNTGTASLYSGDSTLGTSGQVNLASGAGSVLTGDVSIGSGVGIGTNTSSGNIILGSGTATGTGISGYLLLNPGQTVDGNTGDIVLALTNPTGSGLPGHIQFFDGSEGTIGHVWTSLDTDGRGHWAALPASGVTSVVSGTGLVPNTITSVGTVNVDVGTTTGKILQVASGNKYPAIDGNAITNVNAVKLQTFDVNTTTPGASQFLGWNTSNNKWEPKTLSGAVPLSGLTAGTATNTIDSTNFAQLWTWNSLSTQTALSLTSSSTAITSGTLLNVSQTPNGSSVTNSMVTLSAAGSGSTVTTLDIFNSSGSGGNPSTGIKVAMSGNSTGTAGAFSSSSGQAASTVITATTSGASPGTARTTESIVNQGTGDGSIGLLSSMSAATGGTYAVWGQTASSTGASFVGINSSASNNNWVFSGTNSGSGGGVFQGDVTGSGVKTAAILENTITAANNTGTSLQFGAKRTTSGQTVVAQLGGMITDITNTAYQGALIAYTANNAAPAERMRIDYLGRVGIGTTGPQAVLDVVGSGTALSAMIVPRDSTANRPIAPVNGMIRYATDTSRFEMYQSGGWTNFTDVTSIIAGTGMVANTITTTGTLNVDVGTTASKIVQLTAGAQYPAVDGYLITNINNASVKANVTTALTSNYVITAADGKIFCNSSGGSFNVTLPDPSTVVGRDFYVIDANGGFSTSAFVTLVRFGSEKINGITASRELHAPWGFYHVTTNGTDWWVN